MKENKSTTFIILILFGITIYTIFQYNKLKQQTKVSLTNNPAIETTNVDELNAYKVNFKTNVLNNNLNLENIVLKDSVSNTIPLTNIFKKGQKTMLVYRFSQMHCESCVRASIQLFVNWANAENVKNICFLGNYRNNRIFYRTIPDYNIQKMKVYNASDFNLPAESIGYPYCFVLDSNMQISNVFVPDKGIPKLTDEYLEIIQNKLK